MKWEHRPLCDLHIHVGASVAPHIMWSIAHEQGLKLPVKDYWEFVDLITVNPNRVQSLQDYLRILHEWTEKKFNLALAQSSAVSMKSLERNTEVPVSSRLNYDSIQ